MFNIQFCTIVKCLSVYRLYMYTGSILALYLPVGKIKL